MSFLDTPKHTKPIAFTAGEIPRGAAHYYWTDLWSAGQIVESAMIRAECGLPPALDNRWTQEQVDLYCGAYNETDPLPYRPAPLPRRGGR